MESGCKLGTSKAKSHKPQQRQLKHPNTLKQQVEKNGRSRDGKTCEVGKKGLPPSWPHLKILGC
ncbi:hypothetical protein L1049_001780 [Liquidambar formosana]